MSQVLFDAPYFSQSQGEIDEHLESTFEPFDPAIAREAIEGEKRVQKLPLETDTERFEQANDDTPMPRAYCNKEWVERRGAGIFIYDRKSKEHLRTLQVPSAFQSNDSTVERVLLVNDKIFGLTQANRILVWDVRTAEFLEQLALAHEAITQMALSGDKLVVATDKERYLAVSIS